MILDQLNSTGLLCDKCNTLVLFEMHGNPNLKLLLRSMQSHDILVRCGPLKQQGTAVNMRL